MGRSTAHSSPCRQADSGARCVEPGPALNTTRDAHGLVHGFSSGSGARTEGTFLGVCRLGLSLPTLPPGQSLVLGSGIFVAHSQGASGLELPRDGLLAAGGSSERIPAEQRTPAHSSLAEAVALAFTGYESFLGSSLPMEADLSALPRYSWISV